MWRHPMVVVILLDDLIAWHSPKTYLISVSPNPPPVLRRLILVVSVVHIPSIKLETAINVLHIDMIIFHEIMQCHPSQSVPFQIVPCTADGEQKKSNKHRHRRQMKSPCVDSAGSGKVPRKACDARSDQRYWRH